MMVAFITGFIPLRALRRAQGIPPGRTSRSGKTIPSQGGEYCLMPAGNKVFMAEHYGIGWDRYCPAAQDGNGQPFLTTVQTPCLRGRSVACRECPRRLKDVFQAAPYLLWCEEDMTTAFWSGYIFFLLPSGKRKKSGSGNAGISIGLFWIAISRTCAACPLGSSLRISARRMSIGLFMPAGNASMNAAYPMQAEPPSRRIMRVSPIARCFSAAQFNIVQFLPCQFKPAENLAHRKIGLFNAVFPRSFVSMH